MLPNNLSFQKNKVVNKFKDSTTFSLISYLMLIPNLYLVYYSYNLITSTKDYLSAFTNLRNIYYAVYTVLFVVIGVILTTFAYSIASLIKDLFNFL